MKHFLMMLLNGILLMNLQAQDSIRTLLFDRPIHDFGIIYEGEEVRHTFSCWNVSNDTVRLSFENIRTSGANCIRGNFSKMIAPGDTGFVEVVCGTSGRVGSFVKSATIMLPDRTVEAVLITKGVIFPMEVINPLPDKYPVVQLKDTLIDFGLTESHSILVERISIKNSGKDTLKLLQLYSSVCEYKLYSLRGKDINYILPKTEAVLEVKWEKSGAMMKR